MNFWKKITPVTPDKIAEDERYKRAREKEREAKTEFIEDDTCELNVKMKTLRLNAALNIEREIRLVLQNCASLELLNEFVITRTVEYREVPIEEEN